MKLVEERKHDIISQGKRLDKEIKKRHYDQKIYGNPEKRDSHVKNKL